MYSHSEGNYFLMEYYDVCFTPGMSRMLPIGPQCAFMSWFLETGM